MYYVAKINRDKYSDITWKRSLGLIFDLDYYQAYGNVNNSLFMTYGVHEKQVSLDPKLPRYTLYKRDIELASRYVSWYDLYDINARSGEKVYYNVYKTKTYNDKEYDPVALVTVLNSKDIYNSVVYLLHQEGYVEAKTYVDYMNYRKTHRVIDKDMQIIEQSTVGYMLEDTTDPPDDLGIKGRIGALDGYSTALTRQELSDLIIKNIDFENILKNKYNKSWMLLTDGRIKVIDIPPIPRGLTIDEDVALLVLAEGVLGLVDFDNKNKACKIVIPDSCKGIYGDYSSLPNVILRDSNPRKHYIKSTNKCHEAYVVDYAEMYKDYVELAQRNPWWFAKSKWDRVHINAKYVSLRHVSNLPKTTGLSNLSLRNCNAVSITCSIMEDNYLWCLNNECVKDIYLPGCELLKSNNIKQYLNIECIHIPKHCKVNCDDTAKISWDL